MQASFILTRGILRRISAGGNPQRCDAQAEKAMQGMKGWRGLGFDVWALALHSASRSFFIPTFHLLFVNPPARDINVCGC